MKIDTQLTSSIDLKHLLCIHMQIKPYSEPWIK